MMFCKKQHTKNYSISKNKFTHVCIQNNSHITLNEILTNTKLLYTNPEWGFPKGRRSGNEHDIDCAKREFYEETGFNISEYILFDKINPIVEDLQY